MKTYDIVHKLLEDKPELRSSDRKLLWAVWEWQGLAGKSMTRADFLEGVSAESVTRARRKVQELHPELAATQAVKRFRDIKRKQKGTYVFREETQTYYFKPAE